MGEILNQAIERLSSIHFESIGDKLRESHHILISEYFRRANAFIDTLSVPVDKYPIFSVASVLGKTLHVDISKVYPKLEEVNNLYIKALCYCYLEISALADEGVSEALKYVDLYDPMIKLFERGGSFSIRQGEMVVGTSAYPLNYWRDLNIPIKDISDSILDRVDKEKI
ncbi:hypothetical protein [Paenibacillus durus]|uniref:Uncharacterized protein n=1 Tax=Paenibacillus durus ATCC 35681 TaxID=1333534 RepID=A0A0F7FDE3_PAEDU|nr:hypothetical protein [Paenibacillus durus]AKG36438.1 hypothetical protein VK70_19375 [Paenibacillus durus ATCC 35681]